MLWHAALWGRVYHQKQLHSRLHLTDGPTSKKLAPALHMTTSWLHSVSTYSDHKIVFLWLNLGRKAGHKLLETVLSIHSYVLLYIMYCGIPTWKPVLPVDIIDISAMVTRQGACTPPHGVTTWSRDACSQGQSSCWHQCVWKPHSQVLPCSFLSLAVQFVSCTHGESLGMRLYVQYISKVREFTFICH